jgi:proteasome lid subunit RPN8/RPN11
MTDLSLNSIRAHARKEAPNECCGVIVSKGDREIYIPLKNTHKQPVDFFRIAPEEWLAAVGSSESVLSIVHSHVTATSKPSLADRVMCEESGHPWHIYSLVTDSVEFLAPTGFKAPLLGREFIFGVLDCYTLIRDYFKQTLGIELPDYSREFGFWKRGENLYEDNFISAGFRKVTELKKHDCILMKMGQTQIANHCAIYLGDNMILHHVGGRLSNVNPYGGYWLKCSYLYLRHKEMV